MEKINLTGHVYGRLTAISQVLPPVKGGAKWLCRCECGNEKIASTRKLRSGKAKSCGCLTKEWVASFGGKFVDQAMEKVRKHGHAAGYTRSPEYGCWSGMKQRCFNSKISQWDSYGGRGITVFEPWIRDFPAFLSYIGPMPGAGYTVDRLNENGNYEPGNIRWATKQQQGEENKRILIPVTVEGVDYPSISAASRSLGVNIQSVYRRIWRGVAKEKAFDGLKRTI